MKKQFEKSDFKTGVRAVCDDGSVSVVVVVECEMQNEALASVFSDRIFSDILLFNDKGIISGANYDENLRHREEDSRDIIRLYNPPSTPDVLLDPSVKGDLIWQRES